MFRSNHSPLELLRLKRSDSSPVFLQKIIDESNINSNNNVPYQRESSVSPSPSLKSLRRKMDFASSSSLSDTLPASQLQQSQRRSVAEDQQPKSGSTIGQQAAAAAARGAATDPTNGAFPIKSSPSSSTNQPHYHHHQNQQQNQQSPSPVPHKRMLRHQRSLTDDSNNLNAAALNDANKRTANINNKFGENDGIGDDCLSECTSQTSDQSSAHPHYQHQYSNQSSPGHSHAQHQSPSHHHLASKSNLSLLSGSRESNLNTIVHPLVNGIGGSQRPPATRSNSSSSSLFPSSSPPNSSSLPGSKEDRKERRISGSERNRPRRGAMVSCENLLADSSELFSPVPESTLKNLKNSSRKIYRSGGGIFSNPFKSDTEKMEQLTELLRQYRENGIPDPKHFPMAGGNNKFNHLRASSLSISGILSNSNAGNNSNSNTPVSSGSHPTSSSLLSTTKTSLSTTDLHHMNHSSTPNHLHHNHNHHQQTNNGPCNLITLGQNCGQILSSSSFDASYDSNYYLESEWRSIVEHYDRLPGRVQSQNEAIWELLHTEVLYIRRLKVMSETFIACLLSLQNECLLNEIDARSVFSNIGEIYDANHHFWINYLMPMLNHSRDNKCPLNPAMLEEGFTQFDQIFRPYNQYCLEQSSCLQYLKDKRKSNAMFKTYIQWCENNKDCERLRLIDLLVMPMQRLTKYSLLLKAILKKTDNETHKEALKRMELCVERFVVGVNASMFRQQEHEKLSAVVGRIESYDAVDCNNDEAEKFLKDYLFLDLMQSMPGCASQKIRHLYLEDTLKLKDAQSNKIDVHCFLFTDIFLVCKALNKKSIDSKIKVIRQPFITDRLIVRELKDGSGFVMIYLNELNVASTLILLYTPETRTWVDNIRKAQEDYRNLKYSSEQEFATYHANFDEDESYETGPHGLLVAASPRSSSRSSLIHSHSGSQDISEHATMHGHGPCASGPQSVINNNQLAIQQQPPRAISFELGDLRNPSLIVEDTDSFARSQSMDNRSPVVTVTSPRPERRAFLLRNNGKNSSSSNLSSGASSASSSISQLNQSNSLSVSVPCPVQTFLPVQPHPRSGRRSTSNSPQNIMSEGSFVSVDQSTSQISTLVNHSPSTIQVSVHPPPPLSPPPPLPPTSPKKVLSQRNTSRPLPPLPPPPQISHPSPTPLPPPPPPFPPSLLSISSRSQPSNPMTMTINKPPLVKTKNVSCGVASLSYAAEKVSGLAQPVYEKLQTDDSQQTTTIDDETEDELNQMKNNECNEEYLKNPYSQQQKRTCRPDRRYHTADSIEHLKKEKDNSIHKRLSWNYGQQNSSPNHPSSTSYSPHYSHHLCASCIHQCGGGNHLLHPRPLVSSNHSNKCLSNESVYSSSGFSSTGSVPLSVGSTENNCEQNCCGCCGAACLELQKSHFDEEEEEVEHLAHQYSINQASQVEVCSDRDSALPASPALNQSLPTYCHSHSNSQCSMESSSSAPDDTTVTGTGSLPIRRRTSSTSNSSDIKIDVSEVKDGISSVQITLPGGADSVSRPTKSDLRKMKEFLLSNCNVESSDV